MLAAYNGESVIGMALAWLQELVPQLIIIGFDTSTLAWLVHRVARDRFDTVAREPAGVLVSDDGRCYPVDRNYVVGRAPHTDCLVAGRNADPLPLTDPAISPSHLHVLTDGRAVMVRDMGSTYGTFIRPRSGPWQAAPAGMAVPLRPGSTIKMGRRQLWYHATGGPRRPGGRSWQLSTLE